jgi:hypothetical protein
VAREKEVLKEFLCARASRNFRYQCQSENLDADMFGLARLVPNSIVYTLLSYLFVMHKTFLCLAMHGWPLAWTMWPSFY